MFSVTQTVTQSVRLNATVSKRDVTRSAQLSNKCEHIWRQLLRPSPRRLRDVQNLGRGPSNWNAYEGSGEKELTPEEKKAKAKAEEDASNARRAAAAAKMQAEREKAGYKGSIF
ncbi:unnamed protein product [Bathycoccus prasinos]